jgi:SAM-dependent methyltransferase
MKRTAHFDPSIEISHYSGLAGERYYAYQSRDAEAMTTLVARKFSGDVRTSDFVVDFGCGGGYLLKTLSCRQRFGIEINPAARRVAEANGLTCFESLDEISDCTMDVAIAHHSIEHVASPLHILRVLRSKLRPGGALLIVLPIDDWRTQRGYDPGDLNHHLYGWTPLTLGNLLVEAGFDASTLAMTIGVNGWFRVFPRLYPILPRPVSDLVLRLWASIRRTREIRAVIRNPSFDPRHQGPRE